MGRTAGDLEVWRLNGLPIVVRPDTHTSTSVAVLSRCDTYIATSHQLNSPIATTRLLSQTLSRSIDTGMEIRMLALTGNVLLVLDSDGLVAWRLTEEGAVNDFLADRRAGRGDSIWAVSACDLRPDVLG